MSSHHACTCIQCCNARTVPRSEAVQPPYHPDLHMAFVDLVDTYVRASGGRTTPDQMRSTVRSQHFHAIEEAAERMVKGNVPRPAEVETTSQENQKVMSEVNADADEYLRELERAYEGAKMPGTVEELVDLVRRLQGAACGHVFRPSRTACLLCGAPWPFPEPRETDLLDRLCATLGWSRVPEVGALERVADLVVLAQAAHRVAVLQPGAQSKTQDEADRWAAFYKALNVFSPASLDVQRRESVRNPVIETIKSLTPEEQRTVDELSKMDGEPEAVALSVAADEACDVGPGTPPMVKAWDVGRSLVDRWLDDHAYGHTQVNLHPIAKDALVRRVALAVLESSTLSVGNAPESQEKKR